MIFSDGGRTILYFRIVNDRASNIKKHPSKKHKENTTWSLLPFLGGRWMIMIVYVLDQLVQLPSIVDVIFTDLGPS